MIRWCPSSQKQKNRGLPAFRTSLLTCPSSEEEPCDEKYRLSLCVASDVVGRRAGYHHSHASASVASKTVEAWDDVTVVDVKRVRVGYVEEEEEEPPSMPAEC